MYCMYKLSHDAEIAVRKNCVVNWKCCDAEMNCAVASVLLEGAVKLYLCHRNVS